jgi:hypothetical protein
MLNSNTNEKNTIYSVIVDFSSGMHNVCPMKLFNSILCTFVAVFALTGSILAAETFKVSEFNFTTPATWEKITPESSMRAAQLKITDAKTKDTGEVIFFYFGPGNGGGTKANVDRWIGQFTDASAPKSEEKTVGKTKVTYVQVEGTYQSGMPGGPKKAMANHGLLGAIVEGLQGSVFVKFTAPKALVKSGEGDFRKMVEGALKN